MREGDYSEKYKSVYVTLDADTHDAELDRFRRAALIKQESTGAMVAELVPFISVIGNYQRNSISKLDKSDSSLGKSDSSLGKSDSSLGLGKKVKKTSSFRKKTDPQQKMQHDFLKLLNVKDPINGCSGLNVTLVCDMMDKLPSLAKEKYLFSAFPEPITALHMLCALDAPLKCIKRCFMHNVEAVFDTSSTLGSPIHYACTYGANVKIIRYIASNVKDPVAMLSLANRAKRTALHIACLSKDSVELVQLLTAACPQAAGMVDKEGMTPLHLALTVKKPDLAIVEDLTEVCPKAVCMAAKATGSTPLHMALEHDHVDIDIVKDLVVTYPKVCKVVDAAGNTPLHVAVSRGRDFAVIKLLMKKHADAANLPNSEGQTPYAMAKALKNLSKDCLRMLKPTAVVSLV
jgi:ankyrin repeat protein